MSLKGNEKANELTRKRESAPLVEPEPFVVWLLPDTSIIGEIRCEVEAESLDFWKEKLGIETREETTERLSAVCKNSLGLLTDSPPGNCTLGGNLHTLCIAGDVNSRFSRLKGRFPDTCY